VDRPPRDLASRIVWFDAYVTNVDRTARNTNMLMWHRRLWLIDHGATLYFHHTPEWDAGPDRALDPFPLIREHVLLRDADLLETVDEEMAAALTPDVITPIVDLVPDTWLAEAGTSDPARLRAAYTRYLLARAGLPRVFVKETARAR
jgi:hypothetical protein